MTVFLIWQGPLGSAVPKRGRSKCGRTQKHANERKRGQMSAKERKRKSAETRKRAPKGARERKRALPRKNCKQPGFKQPGLGTPNPHPSPQKRKWAANPQFEQLNPQNVNLIWLRFTNAAKITTKDSLQKNVLAQFISKKYKTTTSQKANSLACYLA